MATVNIAYAASTAMGITLTGLTGGAARESNAIDNSSNKYLDAMLTMVINATTGTSSVDKAVYCWFYGSEDGTNYTNNATGSDAGVTLESPVNFKGPAVLSIVTSTGNITSKQIVPSVAQFFGGVLPRKWGVVIQNSMGTLALGSGALSYLQYSGITETVA